MISLGWGWGLGDNSTPAGPHADSLRVTADGARGSREVLCVARHHRLRPRPRHVPCAPPTNAAPHPPISGDRRGNLCKPMSPRLVWRDALSVHRRGACSRRPRSRRWSPPTASCRCAVTSLTGERSWRCCCPSGEGQGHPGNQEGASYVPRTVLNV